MLRTVVDAQAPDPRMLSAALAALARGGVVAFPTDTLYGLGVDPRNPQAVLALFAAKRRPPTQAIPVVAADVAQVLEQVGALLPLAQRLVDTFWPGPLTLILTASPRLAPAVHVGTGRIAVRVPDHPVARMLAALAGHPLTATSANLSGAAPAAAPGDLSVDLERAIDVLVDAGPAPGGPPSTIVDATRAHPVLVREGAVPWARVLESIHTG